MSTLADYRTAIDELVTQSQLTGTAEKDRAIQRAMQKHSKHRPRRVIEDITGAGTFKYTLSSGLTYWDDDFSTLLQVEYPVDDTDDDKDILDPEEWELYEAPAGLELHFLEAEPSTSESMRLTYTAEHTCTDTACTVPTAEEDAVQVLAAAFFCRTLAALHSQDSDSTIAADSVDQGSKRRNYAAMAKAYEAEYNEQLGIKPGSAAPASVSTDWDVNYQGGGDRLTHSRRYR